MKNVVGTRIREARSRNDGEVTQQQLAARVQAMGVDIDQTAISRIESGERQVTDIEIIALARALSINVVDLFEGVDLPEGG